jgi:4-diphosphocytidyl-2-C-methyl-D-erythritol kinase
VRAPAKINLWLNVVGRRADGYHLLDSLIAFTDLADEIEAVSSERLVLTVDGPLAPALAGETDNLVLKAARLLADFAGVAPRAALHLTKHIPVAAGLGGGSADAAAALQALVELWRVALPVEELFDLAGRIGADVPMCLAGRPARASGVGERLAPAPPLPSCAILLVNPGVALPTAQVFAARHGDFSRRGRSPSRGPTCQASWRRWPSAATISPTQRSRFARRSPMCSPSCARARAPCTLR